MTAPEASTTAAGPVLFFDGECGLCTRLVRLLLKLDSARAEMEALLEAGGQSAAEARFHQWLAASKIPVNHAG